MSARDELRAMISANGVVGLADVILAAGFRKHRTITTYEELEALPFEAVVRDAEGFILERWGEPEEHLWATPMNGAYIPQPDIDLPATVLYEPEPQP